MNLTSNYSAPLGLPNGQTVPPKGSVEIKDDAWSEMKDHVVVAAWLKDEKLSEGKADAKKAKAPTKAVDDMSDDELRALLKEKGVTAHAQWPHDKLVAEAKKAAA